MQLDADRIFVATDRLATFALVGESLEGRAVKSLRLALYGPATPPERGEYVARLYAFEDTPCAELYCRDQERRLGGVRLDRARPLAFRDGGSELCVELERVSPSWRSPPGASRHEVPFDRVWGSRSNAPHVSIALERRREDDSLEFDVVAYQRAEPTRRVRLRASLGGGGGARAFTITENPLAIAIDREPDGDRDGDRDRDRDGECVEGDAAFKLPARTKRRLRSLLDPPSARGDDWRALATRLGVDRYATWFATKSSPTSYILELWECRERAPAAAAVAALASTLRRMNRDDAADALLQTTPAPPGPTPQQPPAPPPAPTRDDSCRREDSTAAKWL